MTNVMGNTIATAGTPAGDGAEGETLTAPGLSTDALSDSRPYLATLPESAAKVAATPDADAANVKVTAPLEVSYDVTTMELVGSCSARASPAWKADALGYVVVFTTPEKMRGVGVGPGPKVDGTGGGLVEDGAVVVVVVITVPVVS